MKKNITDNNYLNDIKVSTICAGIKKTPNNEDDLLLIEFEKKSFIAGVFTQSLTSSASVNQCKRNLQSSKEPIVRAILVNSGNANAFTGKLGEETVVKISKYLSQKLNCKMNHIFRRKCKRLSRRTASPSGRGPPPLVQGDLLPSRGTSS